jgi:transposase
VIGVELWAEVRRMYRVERLSIREIHRRTGLHRNTIRRALSVTSRRAIGARRPRRCWTR